MIAPFYFWLTENGYYIYFLLYQNNYKKMQQRAIIFKIPLVAAITSFVVFFVALYFGWFGAPTGAGTSFCESGYSGLIKQPVNTWSNLGFIVVGLYIGFIESRRPRNYCNNLFSKGLFFSSFYATLAVLLGPGSMALHATTTRIGGFFDMLAMFMIASFLVSYASKRLFGLLPIGFFAVFTVLMAICIYFEFQTFKVPFVGHAGSFVFGVLLILASIIELFQIFIRKVNIKVGWGIAAILTMVLAFYIWNISLTGKPFCDPSSLVQGHGIWHLLNATSIFFLYKYYISEHSGV